ncbi:hypothetical protein HPG69_017163 [Diceros bicornis minor]|uniref:Uncharacterized protein n=1 Tax=Diceros bicornis minor TaxID=77932 RepID=A0A7J7ECX9_DICBM|nr:hypothetical protein HPG69_017163 [Diceros bicornis minor]
MACARPLIVYSEKGESSGKNVTLPAVFKAPIRPDIVIVLRKFLNFLWWLKIKLKATRRLRRLFCFLRNLKAWNDVKKVICMALGVKLPPSRVTTTSPCTRCSTQTLDSTNSLTYNVHIISYFKYLMPLLIVLAPESPLLFSPDSTDPSFQQRATSQPMSARGGPFMHRSSNSSRSHSSHSQLFSKSDNFAFMFSSKYEHPRPPDTCTDTLYFRCHGMSIASITIRTIDHAATKQLDDTCHNILVLR